MNISDSIKREAIEHMIKIRELFLDNRADAYKHATYLKEFVLFHYVDDWQIRMHAIQIEQDIINMEFETASYMTQESKARILIAHLASLRKLIDNK